MTLIVRDEADILRDFIEYHYSAGVDFILALDNRSQDGTADILRGFERGGGLLYLYEASGDFRQDEWMTALARRAWLEYDADWVINADADEFYLPREGTLRDILRNILSDIFALSVTRHDMVPIVRPMRSSPLLEMLYRKRESLEWVIGHPIADKVIHRGFPDVTVDFGAHGVHSRFLSRIVPCPDIFTLHFPIRSLSQFERKVRNVGEGLLRGNRPGSRYDYWLSALGEGRLDEVFTTYQLSPEQITQKLASGEIIEDRRLADSLGSMRHPSSGLAS
jgi:hypothetical protein